MISTKGRYALRIMVYLAEHGGADFIPLHGIADKENISKKYLESILVTLTKEGYLLGSRGKGGGYKLTRSPSDYTVGSILRLTEGELAPVACLRDPTIQCQRSHECRTLPMWKRFYDLTNDYFNSITLADLMRTEGEIPFC